MRSSHHHAAVGLDADHEQHGHDRVRQAPADSVTPPCAEAFSTTVIAVITCDDDMEAFLGAAADAAQDVPPVRA